MVRGTAGLDTGLELDQPLAEISVLELGTGRWSAASLAAHLLVTQGARVVLAAPGSWSLTEPLAGWPDDLVRIGKEVATERIYDSNTFLRAAVRYDVVITDVTAVEWLHEAGLSIETLPRLLPGCVIVPVTEFGTTGPWKDRTGSEMIVQALAGIMSTNGYPDDSPLRAGVSVAALGAAFIASAAIEAALVERLISGRGQLVDQASFDTAVGFLGTFLPDFLLEGREFTRVGNRHLMASPWNSYPTRDGSVLICTMSDSHFQILATEMGQQWLVADPRFGSSITRVVNADQIDEIIGQWTGPQSTLDVVRRLTSAGIAAGPVLELHEALRDPQALQDEVLIGGPARRLGSITRVWRMRNVGSAERTERLQTSSLRARGDGGGPLSGVVVIEVAALTAGPLMGRLLALLGATVIKVEPPSGEPARRLIHQVDGAGYLFHLNNTDKYGITLDLDLEEDRSRMQRLVASADVFLTNLTPKTLRRMGLTHEKLFERNQSLVYCGILGYGSTGPYSGRRLLDTVAQGQGGIMALTGQANSPPLKVAVSIADLLTACSGLSAVVAGLYASRRSGGGALVNPSLYDTAVWSTHEEWWRADNSGVQESRLGNRHSLNAPHNLFFTLDGIVAIAVENDEQWRRLAPLLGTDQALDAALHTAKGRVERVADVEQLVRGWCRSQTTAQVEKACREARVSAAAPASVAEVVGCPQVLHRQMLIELTSSDGKAIWHLGSPFCFSRTPAKSHVRAPRLGEHNEFIAQHILGRAPKSKANVTEV